MEQMAIHQEAAYERLYRWMQSMWKFKTISYFMITTNFSSFKMNADYFVVIRSK